MINVEVTTDVIPEDNNDEPTDDSSLTDSNTKEYGDIQGIFDFSSLPIFKQTIV